MNVTTQSRTWCLVSLVFAWTCQLTENSTEPWTNGLMKLSSVSRHLREIANSYLQYPLDWVLTRGQNAQLRSDDGSTSPVSFLYPFE